MKDITLVMAAAAITLAVVGSVGVFNQPAMSYVPIENPTRTTILETGTGCVYYFRKGQMKLAGCPGVDI